MLAYVLRRLAVAVVLLFVLSIVTFVMYFKIPQNPAGFVLDLQRATPEQIAQVDHELGIDRPVYVQYEKYVRRALHGDLGVSWASQSFFARAGLQGGVPVRDIVWRGARVTGSLVVGGFLLLLALAIPLGTFVATRPARRRRPAGARSLARRDLDAPARRRAAAAALRRQPLAPRARLRLLHLHRPVGGGAGAGGALRQRALRRAGRLGLAPGPAVGHLRALLRRPLPADDAGADARGARGALRPHGPRQGRLGADGDPQPRAPQRDRARRDDGRHGRGDGDRDRPLRRDGVRAAGPRADDDRRACRASPATTCR